MGSGAAPPGLSWCWPLPRPRPPLHAATGEAFAPELLEQVRDLELQGVSAAESGDVSTALERFSQAIRLLPERASGYNNRAQALRLRGDVAGEQSAAAARSQAAPRYLRQPPGMSGPP